MVEIGILQGRLTPSNGRGIQFFPFDNWENEFGIIKELGISYMEWIFDYDRYELNPIWTDDGCQKICRHITESDVSVRTVCFDYFMRRPFYKDFNMPKLYDENVKFLVHVSENLASIGGKYVEISLVDSAYIENEKEREAAIRYVQECADLVAPKGIILVLETNMRPGVFRQFLEDIGKKNVMANYDSGDSAGMGFDAKEEISSLKEYVGNVHLKDKPVNGISVALGKGDANFDGLFEELKKMNYSGGITLQVGRGDDGDEKKYIADQLKFMQDYCRKYGISF